MIPLTAFAGRTLAVLGLGASGLATVEALRAGGARTLGWDDSEAARRRLAALGCEPVDLGRADFSSLDALVLSPGVALTHPEPHWSVRRAHEADIEIIGDTELFARQLAHLGSTARIVAITGTNGKSTTVALLGHVLRAAGLDVRVGGNIGRPVLALDPPGDDTVCVIEYSSYQIDLTPGLHAAVAILLNISPDHLDRHGRFEDYARIKARIFDHQVAGDAALLGIDDGEAAKLADRLAGGCARYVPFSAARPLDAGVYVERGIVKEGRDGAHRAIADIGAQRALRGRHNWQNAAAATAAALALGVDAPEISAGLASFPGLIHRMDVVGTAGGVEFVNDSKATNAEAASHALAAFERIFWIAGGQAKAGGIASLNSFFPKIEKVYLIGDAAEDFAATLRGRVEAVMCGTLDRAVREAARDAMGAGHDEAVVLLSPACASFDQFEHFEARGDEFRKLVARLDGVTMNERV